MAATYPVTCTCGHTYHVPGSAAGGQYTCRCGRPIEVPSLSRLKAQAGMPVASPEFILTGLIMGDSLPLEKDCVNCGRATTEVATYSVICERPIVVSSISWWQWLFLCISPIKLLFMVAFGHHDGAVSGTDVTLRLPVRVCPECMETLTTPGVVRTVMCLTPEYARLFEKFPAATIHNAD